MSMDRINFILNELEKLPEHWHKGGGSLSPTILRAIVKYAPQQEISYSIETGTGKSTVLFSHISKNHKVFSVNSGDCITVVMNSPLLNKETVEIIEGPTQLTLPKYNFQNKFQLALLDGPHAYPFPDLEYYYIYPHLETDALLIIDNINIPTINNLFNFLKEDEMFRLLEVIDTAAFFRRTDKPIFPPTGNGWEFQNYNKKRFPIKQYRYKFTRLLAYARHKLFSNYE